MRPRFCLGGRPSCYTLVQIGDVRSAINFDWSNLMLLSKSRLKICTFPMIAAAVIGVRNSSDLLWGGAARHRFPSESILLGGQVFARYQAVPDKMPIILVSEFQITGTMSVQKDV